VKGLLALYEEKKEEEQEEQEEKEKEESDNDSSSCSCSCLCYGIMRTGNRVKIDCGGFLCGYLDST
jgi:hypothetical protein